MVVPRGHGTDQAGGGEFEVKGKTLSRVISHATEGQARDHNHHSKQLVATAVAVTFMSVHVTPVLMDISRRFKMAET